MTTTDDTTTSVVWALLTQREMHELALQSADPVERERRRPGLELALEAVEIALRVHDPDGAVRATVEAERARINAAENPTKPDLAGVQRRGRGRAE